jgi:putative flippase GtrA
VSVVRLHLDAEKWRFIVAGAWNSLFGWLAFAALWKLLGTGLSLWSISALAHLAATTQAFCVQRRLVFRSGDPAIARQFFRFQLSYLVLLGVGALAVNGLSAQGMHPLVAQVLAIGVLAVCGYLMGKAFTFSERPFRVAHLMGRLARAAWQARWAWVAFSACLAAGLAAIVRSAGHAAPVPEPAFVGGLRQGAAWIASQGWIAGWFNPPAAADGRVLPLFHSPLQLAAVWLDWPQALRATALLLSAAGFWWCHALARRRLLWHPAAATLFAALGFAGGWFVANAPRGDPGLATLATWPAVALALTAPADTARRGIPWASIAVALWLTLVLRMEAAALALGVLAAVLFALAAIDAGARPPGRTILARAAGGLLGCVLLNASYLAGLWRPQGGEGPLQWFAQLLFWMLLTLLALRGWQALLAAMGDPAHPSSSR